MPRTSNALTLGLFAAVHDDDGDGGGRAAGDVCDVDGHSCRVIDAPGVVTSVQTSKFPLSKVAWSPALLQPVATPLPARCAHEAPCPTGGNLRRRLVTAIRLCTCTAGVCLRKLARACVCLRVRV
jgi:hypothetical protein